MPKWEPVIDYTSPDYKKAYIDAVLTRAENKTITVSYWIRRAVDDDKHKHYCPVTYSDDDESFCGNPARYIITSTVVNGMKDTTRVNVTAACSLRHVNRRVREYFGLTRSRDYEDATPR